MKENIPKLEFSVAPLNETFQLIHHFLNPSKKRNWDWSSRIYEGYSKLKSKLDGVKEIKKRKEIEHNFFEEVFKKEKNELERKRDYFQKEWDKINNKIMLALSEIVEQKWDEKDKKVYGRVSLNTICPRYIKVRTFDLFYRFNDKDMIRVAIHELSHFIYFDKWKKVFPKTKEKEFDNPHLIWHLSEMVPKIILNDKRIQKIFKYKFTSYNVYENFKLNGKPLLLYLQEFYDNREDFEDFLKKSWKFVQKYEKEIKAI
ncbi:MAG: hypothetical protein AABW51_01895 [Nanoarchaeota archaeon]